MPTFMMTVSLQYDRRKTGFLDGSRSPLLVSNSLPITLMVVQVFQIFHGSGFDGVQSLLSLCRQIVRAQNAEIAQMQRILQRY